MYFSWKLSGYIVTLNRILVKCFNQASWKFWHSIHIVIYIHIDNCHLHVTSLYHGVAWLCCFITLWQFTKATLLPSSLACNCFAASLNATDFITAQQQFPVVVPFSSSPFPHYLGLPIPYPDDQMEISTWIPSVQFLLLKWIPTNSTGLDSIRELEGEHWGWAVIATKPDTYLALPLRDGE